MKTTARASGLFTTPMLSIVDSPADDAHQGGRRAMPPQFIYLHATGGVDSLAWLTRTSDPPVSSHRLISKDGTIHKLVPDENMAYTQGFGVMGWHKPKSGYTCNTDGLSIELENLDTIQDKYPPNQIMSAALQVYEWVGRWGLLPILGHYDVDTRKKDPAYLPWGQFWDMLYRLMRGEV